MLLVADEAEPAGGNIDSCVFTNGSGEESNEEVDTDNPHNVFIMPVEKRGYLGKKSKDWLADCGQPEGEQCAAGEHRA